MRKHKLVTITIHEDHFRVIKDYCREHNIPFSRFVSNTAWERVKGESVISN